MRFIGYLLGASGAACALATLPAQAQDGNMFQRDRNISVRERPKPEYQTPGIQRGAFIYQPRLDADLEFNDNIYATPSATTSDTVAIINPSLNVRSTWSRHSLAAGVSVPHREYFDQSSETTTDVNANARLGLDIKQGYSASLTANYANQHEARTSAGAANRALNPLSYDNFGVTGEFVRQVGRTRLSAQLGWRQSDFDDVALIGGGIADQDFRDNQQTIAEVRGAYAISPDKAIFARLRYADQDYDSTDGAGRNRSQSGLTFDVGTNFDISDLVRGEIGVGVVTRDFDDPTLGSTESLSLSSEVEWFPTPLLTVTFNADRNFQPSGLNNSANILSTSVSARADYEFRRNVIFNLFGGYVDVDFDGINRSDEVYTFSAGGTYLLNRNVGVNARLERNERQSSGANAGGEFTVDRILVGVVLQR